MGLFTIIDEDKHREIDNYRIVSDNYRVYLFQEHYRQDSSIFHGETPLLTLTNNSLEKFNIKANDEIKIKKPCTRKTAIVTVIHKGFNFSLTFAKTTDDIDSMMFQQYIQYHGKGQNMDNQNRTPKGKDGLPVSVYGDQERNAVLPTYSLGIEIWLYDEKKGERRKIFYKFYNVTFFNFEQDVNGKSADIMESIQAFAPFQNYESPNTDNKFTQHVSTLIQGLTLSPIGKQYILNKPNKIKEDIQGGTVGGTVINGGTSGALN